MKQIIRNILFGASLLLAAGFATSCSDDELSSKDLIAYIKTEASGNTTKFKIAHTPSASEIIGDIEPIFASTSREVPASAEIIFGVDNSLIGAYNTANGTDYQPLPASAYTLSFGGSVQIDKDTYKSTKAVGLEITDVSGLREKKGYLVPLTISKINSKDKGIRTSTNTNVVYYVIGVESINVKPVTTESMAGNLASKTGWTCVSTTNNMGATTDRVAFINGNYTDGTYLSSLNTNTYVVLDFGAVKTIKGVKLYTYNYSATLNMTPTAFEVSTASALNGVSTAWDYIGACTNSIAGAYVTPIPNGEVPYFIEFYAPVTTRYLKIRHTASMYSTYWGTRELDIVE